MQPGTFAGSNDLPTEAAPERSQHSRLILCFLAQSVDHGYREP